MTLTAQPFCWGQEADDLATNFVSPPASAAPQTWWHWVNGNITKEGITADLESMKRVGLGGATIVNVSLLPPGKVDFMSADWRDLVQHAVHEADRLGLQMGIENCAGWSSSGGPWITPAEGMQMVTFSEVQIKSGTPFSGAISQPETNLDTYRDIAVLAFPTPALDLIRMSDFSPQITSSDPQFNPDKIDDAAGAALTRGTKDAPQYVQYEFAQPFTVRTLALSMAPNFKGEIQVSDDGTTFHAVGNFNYHADNGDQLVGVQDFEIPATTSRFFRIVFQEAGDEEDGHISIFHLDLRPAPAVDDFRAKADYVRDDRLPPASTMTIPAGAAIDPAQVINLTAHFNSDSGALNWTPPPGNWTIFRIGYTPTGVKNHPAPKDGEGLEVDKLSRAALKIHWDNLMAKVIADSGPLAGKTLNHTLIDSYEVGSQNWTAGFEQEFQKRQGYDLTPYLPALAGHIVGGAEQSDRVLWDFRRTIADLFVENYYDYMAELAHQSGLLLSTETYGDGSFDNLLSGRNADVPMTEFWAPGPAGDDIKNGPMISHVYGKTLAGAESFTAAATNTQQYPQSLKALGDKAFTCGINHMSFHRFAHQPWLNRFPGMAGGPWGSDLERTNTWWEQGRAWIQYLTRCQYLLQQGQFVADVLVLGQEGSPSNFPDASVPDGHDWDGCNDDVVLHRLTVKDGKLTLPDGLAYRVLQLPDNPAMTPELLRKLKELADDGATIIGPKPAKSPSFRGYPQCDAEVGKLADELWDKGKITTRTLDEVSDALTLPPDFECADTSAGFSYIHRVSGKADFYFISNQRETEKETDCLFRVTGKAPELWYPDTGRIVKMAAYEEDDGRTRLHLRLDPLGSVFVVFREAAPENHPVTLTRAMPPEAAEQSPLQIQHAVFGNLGEPQSTKDVTDLLTALVKKGFLETAAVPSQLGGDPAPGVVKHLQVDYLLDGKPDSITVAEGETLVLGTAPVGVQFPSAEVGYAADGSLQIEAWEQGDYTVTSTKAKDAQVKINALPPPLELSGPWQVAFPPSWGAPAAETFDKLISWSDHADPGVQHFSGTATYTKNFTVPAALTGPGHRLYLDLGKVDIIAEVKLNGKNLGILWKPPFCVEVTDAIQPGSNSLEIAVTNLWINRLIGDEQLPPDCEWDDNETADGNGIKAWPDWLLEGKPSPTGRFTFTAWRHWFQNSPLSPSGLIGPVVLHPAIVQPVAD